MVAEVEWVACQLPGNLQYEETCARSAECVCVCACVVRSAERVSARVRAL